MSARICRRSSRSKFQNVRRPSRSSAWTAAYWQRAAKWPEANVSLKDLPPYLPKAFIAIEDRRFYSHYGVDPLGILRAAVTNIAAPRRVAGRLDADAATRQEPVPHPGAHACTKAAGGRTRALAGAEAHQGADSRTLPQPRLLRLRRLWRRGGRAEDISASPRKNVTLAEAAMLAGLVKSPSRLAPNRNPEGAEARARSCSGRWRTRNSSPTSRRSATIAHPSYAVKPVGAGTINYVADWVGEVLDDLVGQIDQRHRRRNHHRSETAERGGSRRDRRTGRKKRQVQCQPGRAGGDDARRRGPRHGRRPQLRRQPVQPRGHGEAAARLRVQAVRLSHRDRGRADARDDPAGRSARHQGLAAGKLRPRIFRLGDADPGACDVAQHRRGPARTRGRRRRTWCAPRTGSASPQNSSRTPRSRSARPRCRRWSWSAPTCRSPMAAMPPAPMSSIASAPSTATSCSTRARRTDRTR